MRTKQTQAQVVVQGRAYKLGHTGRLDFGRGGDETSDVVALDPSDMGISAVAGSVYFEGGRWVVANRSRKRPLLVEAPSHGGQIRVGCQHIYALCDAQVVVLVPGLRYTHRVEVRIPETDVAPVASAAEGGKTVVVRDLCRPDDIVALTALFSGYLRPFPYHDRHPLTYREAASLAGMGEVALRKRIENFRGRLSRSGIADIGGDKALYDLADFLLDQGVIGPEDLDRLLAGQPGGDGGGQ
ncbi:MAG: hypothetical protein ABR540_18800 [Acidimicrobiales bacterium]